MTTSQQKLINYHIRRLQDKRPDVRIKSIRELALLGAEEALEALHEVFQNDPDDEVKRAAQEAGREIFVKSRAGKVIDE